MPDTETKPALPGNPADWTCWGVLLTVDRAGNLPPDTMTGTVEGVYFDEQERPVTVALVTAAGSTVVVPWHRVVAATAKHDGAPEWLR